eukprot:1149122-Pelagomonas_calceolata.AAC.4
MEKLQGRYVSPRSPPLPEAWHSCQGWPRWPHSAPNGQQTGAPERMKKSSMFKCPSRLECTLPNLSLFKIDLL